MKNFKLKAKLALAGAISAIALVVMPAVALAGYAPSNRPTFQCITPTNCPGAEYVVFNSFTNAPNYGDERAFLDAKSASITGPGGYQDKISGVKDGAKYIVRAYVHNNANPNAIGESAATAINTKLQVILPTGENSHHVAGANLSADNASPRNVSDTVDFSGSTPFTVQFDKSAPVQVTYRPNGQGGYVTRTLPGASFSNNYTMNADLGNFKGCFNYASLVTMTVVVHTKELPPPPKPPEKPPVTPPETPPQTPPSTPPSLPNTGPGNVIAGFFGITSLSSALYYAVTRRLSRYTS
ncbi:MAG TPA: hypothetical protein VFK11_02730 [Candidatus Saccharimonadales bacterium]|nr:hypothetical protein [Candidatus Saccharimonadales bacterium]